MKNVHCYNKKMIKFFTEKLTRFEYFFSENNTVIQHCIVSNFFLKNRKD